MDILDWVPPQVQMVNGDLILAPFGSRVGINAPNAGRSALQVVGTTNAASAASSGFGIAILYTGTGAVTDNALIAGVYDANYAWLQGVKPGSFYLPLLLNPNGGNVSIGTTTTTARLMLPAGSATASTAPLKFTSGTNTSTAEAGAVEYDGSSVQYTDGSTARGLVPRSLFAATADKTIANTTTETTLFGSGVGSLTLPANFFVAGRSVRVNLYGYIAGVTTPNIRLRARLGGTQVCDTGAIASVLTLSVVEGLRLSVILTCRSTGGSGTVIGQAYWEIDGNTGFQGSETNATTTVDTTASQALDVTWEWGTASASNTLTITNATVEVLH